MEVHVENSKLFVDQKLEGCSSSLNGDDSNAMVMKQEKQIRYHITSSALRQPCPTTPRLQLTSSQPEILELNFVSNDCWLIIDYKGRLSGLFNSQRIIRTNLQQSDLFLGCSIQKMTVYV